MRSRWSVCAGLLLGLYLLTGSVALGQKDDKEFEGIADEILSIAKRTPECMVDSNGLPKRVIITRNGAGLFEKPEAGAKKVTDLSLYRRMYLYVANKDGFHRVGEDPFGEGQSGWVPADFCLIWDHNEMLFLNQDSVPEDVNQVHVWKTEDAAREGNVAKAIYSEDIDREKGAVTDLFFPVLQKDKTGTLYQIGFIQGGEGGTRDDSGQRLTPAQRKQIVKNIDTVNVMIVIDATSSMDPYTDEAKARAADVVEALQGLKLPALTKDESPIKLTVNVGLTAYKDTKEQDSEYENKVWCPLTNDPDKIKTAIAGLTAGGGGDRPEMVMAGIRKAFEGFAQCQGALNRIILIGDSPDHDRTEAVLAKVGEDAKSKFIQLNAFVCGGAEDTKHDFGIMASASGGKVEDIANAKEFIEKMVEDLKARAKGIPIEGYAVRTAVDEGIPIGTALKRVSNDEKQVRMMMKFLKARGADVATGMSLREGWVKVRSGAGARFKVFVYLPRWELAHDLSTLLGLSDRISSKKNLAKDAKAVVSEFLKLPGGEKASAGLDKENKTAAERAGNLPETTTGIDRGEEGAVRFERKNRMKILELLTYWRNPDRWEHDHVWVPVELLP